MDRWETGICDCCNGNCGLWALACVCPCVVYAQNLAMMREKGIPSNIPVCDNNAVVPGCIHGAALYSGYISSYFVTGGFASLGCVSVIMQCVTRGDIRNRYGIKGCFQSTQPGACQACCNCCEDCCCASCCMSCALVQERVQLRKEARLAYFYPELHNSMFLPGQAAPQRVYINP